MSLTCAYLLHLNDTNSNRKARLSLWLSKQVYDKSAFITIASVFEQITPNFVHLDFPVQTYKATLPNWSKLNMKNIHAINTHTVCRRTYMSKVKMQIQYKLNILRHEHAQWNEQNWFLLECSKSCLVYCFTFCTGKTQVNLKNLNILLQKIH